MSLTVAEVLRDRFSVALNPITVRDTNLGDRVAEETVNLEADLFVKSAHELHASASLVASRSIAALPSAGELRGSVGVEKCAAQLAAGGGVLIHDPDREADAEVVFAGARLRPESFVFPLTQVRGHTTFPATANVSTASRSRRSRAAGSATARPPTTRSTWPRARGQGSRRPTARRRCAALQIPTRSPPTSCNRATCFRWRDGRAGSRSVADTPKHRWPCAIRRLPTVAAICEVMGSDGLS